MYLRSERREYNSRVTFITAGLNLKQFLIMVMTQLHGISQTDTGIRMRAISYPTKPESKNTGFIDRWNRKKHSKYIEIHSDICNVQKFLLPGVWLQIKFTKAKPSFYLMNTKVDSTTIFKFLDAKL